jgi:hypothetical protein
MQIKQIGKDAKEVRIANESSLVNTKSIIIFREIVL